MERRAVWPAVFFVGLLCLGALLALFVVGSVVLEVYPNDLSSKTSYTDIAAGRYRVEQRLFLAKISDQAEETEVTALYRDLIGPPPPPNWQPANYWSPSFGRHAYHYIYNWALALHGKVRLLLKTPGLERAVQRAILLRYFELLPRDGRTDAAEQYLDQVEKFLERNRANPGGVTVDSLPKPAPP